METVQENSGLGARCPAGGSGSELREGVGGAGTCVAQISGVLLRVATVVFALALAGAAPTASAPELRAEVAEVASRLATAQAQRMELERSLKDVAQRIRAMKAKNVRGVFRGDDLDVLLRRSQELSSQVTVAIKAEILAGEALRASRGRLAIELDGELATLRRTWDAARNGTERQALVRQLRSLRTERDALRPAVPSPSVPAASEKASDDPDDLIERADALYDSEDKLRREEAQLATRIEELRGERELERRMGDLLGEDALFNEHDRRLPSALPSVNSPGPLASDKPGKTAAGPTMRAETPSGPAPASPGPVRTKIRPLADLRNGDDESLEQLAARRDQLRKLADDLHHRADEAVRTARSLR